MDKHRRDLIAGLVLLAFAVLIYVSSFSIRTLVMTTVVGPGFMPRLGALGLGVLSLATVVQSLLRLRAASASSRLSSTDAAAPAPPEPDAPTPLAAAGGRRGRAVLLTFLLLILYLGLLNRLGFLLSTAGYLFGQFWVLAGQRKRRFWLWALLGIGISAFVYYLFRRVFILMLPEGILG